MNTTLTPKIDIRLLLALEDFSTMPDVALLDIAGHAQLLQIAGGKKLAEGDLQDKHLYLLEGEVQVASGKGTAATIAAGSERARAALYRLYTPGLRITCTRPSRLLQIDSTVFRKYYTGVRTQDDSVTLVEYSDVDGADPADLLAAEIRQSFSQGQVSLPSLPEVARYVNQALQDPDIDFRRVAGVIQSDPVIATRVLQVANSPLYLPGRPAESLRDAITRIGLEATRAIVVSVVLRGLYRPQVPLFAERMQRFYDSSVRVGVLSQVIARRVPRLDPDRAFLAGLVHDIGVVPVLVAGEAHAQLHQDSAALEAVIDRLRGPIGAMLLGLWAFEPDLVAVAEEAKRWNRAGGTQADYCDVVQVAQLHCPLIGGASIPGPSLSDVPAFRRLGMDPAEGIKVLQEAKQRMKDGVRRLLA
jgi:HD-like signal output (HDOD) protein